MADEAEETEEDIHDAVETAAISSQACTVRSVFISNLTESKVHTADLPTCKSG